METSQVLLDLKIKCEQIVEKLKSELVLIRTGKPNSALVEEIVVNTYGGSTKLRLKELSSITSEPPQSLLITPFDPSTTTDIETAILSSQLNITPQTQGNAIRVSFPPLTQDQRTMMSKVVSTKVEEYQEHLRGVRDDSRKRIKSLFDNKLISEDDRYKSFESVDKITKNASDSLEAIKTKKIEDLMTV